MNTRICLGEVRAAQAGAAAVRQGDLAENVTCWVSRAVFGHVDV